MSIKNLHINWVPALWINFNTNFLDDLNIFSPASRHFSIFKIYPCIYFFTWRKFKIRSRSKKGKGKKFPSIEASLIRGTTMNHSEILVIFRSVYFVPVLEPTTPMKYQLIRLLHTFPMGKLDPELYAIHEEFFCNWAGINLEPVSN